MEDDRQEQGGLAVAPKNGMSGWEWVNERERGG